MRGLLFPFHPGLTNKCGQAIPGKQFFLWLILATAAMTDFAETILISLHLLQQYHSDHHLMLPSEKGLFLRKKADECRREQNRGSRMVSGAAPSTSLRRPK